MCKHNNTVETPHSGATDARSRGIRFLIGRSRPLGPPGKHEDTRAYRLRSPIEPPYSRSSDWLRQADGLIIESMELLDARREVSQ